MENVRWPPRFHFWTCWTSCLEKLTRFSELDSGKCSPIRSFIRLDKSSTDMLTLKFGKNKWRSLVGDRIIAFYTQARQQRNIRSEHGTEADAFILYKNRSMHHYTDWSVRGIRRLETFGDKSCICEIETRQNRKNMAPNWAAFHVEFLSTFVCVFRPVFWNNERSIVCGCSGSVKAVKVRPRVWRKFKE